MVGGGKGADPCREDGARGEYIRGGAAQRREPWALYVWRRQAREAREAHNGEALFAAVRPTRDEDRKESAGAETQSAATPAASGAIEVSISDAMIRVPMGAAGATLDAVISALRRIR